MAKVIKIEVIDGINWAKVANKNSIQKKALREAVKYAGNGNRLAILMKMSNPRIYKWIYDECQRGEDLVPPVPAIKMGKATKIKGLAERLCPSLKK